MTQVDQDTALKSAAPRYFSIAPGQPFLPELAKGLRAAVAAEPGLDLADALIYLPTRRAVRALAQGFIDTAPDARASLLPQIKALGDMEEDDLIVFDGAVEDDLALPPAIAPAERRLALARLVAEKDKACFDGQRDWAGAIAAADELGKLLDSLYTEEVDPALFETLVPESLALHWRRSLEFLSILTEAWPAYLEAQGLMDPAARRIALINRHTARLQARPPQTPIVVAGTTGSTPAVARMMKTIAAAPLGCVVLPGLDLDAPPHVWDAIDEPHPQSGLKALLETLDISRAAVRRWPAPAAPAKAVSERTSFMTMALRPAGASDDWRAWAQGAKADPDALAAGLADVQLVEARDEDFEAAAVALKMREALESKARTAMLVTPDRDLARRVSVKMRRWGVVVDDSGGVPFANTPCGTYLRLIAAWLADIADPVALLAALDHPLFGGGLDASERRSAAAAFDSALRGLKPAPGLSGLARKLEASGALNEPAQKLLAAIKTLAPRWPARDASFQERFEAHLEIAEGFCATDTEDGEKRLWRGDDGATGAQLLAALREGLAHIAQDSPSDYPAIFSRLIAGAPVRRRTPSHPRLAILGPLEARLQTADVVILGGLNEGVWPRDAAIDPFLSRPMRATLGLPSPERRIGLAAHDFMQLSAAPELMLTRSTRIGGKPAKPSRWIVRLKNIVKGAGALQSVERTTAFETLAMRLDQPARYTRIAAPAPTPPVAARPTRFFVTRIETLLRDPYAIYARAILRLEKRDAHGEDFGARHIGNLFHKALEDYAAAPPPEAPASRVQKLRRLFDSHARDYGLTENHRAVWNARIDEALAWLAAWDATRRTKGAPAVIEGKGLWETEIDGRRFTLGAYADRIDRLDGGSAFIVDYKTGQPPTLKQNKTFSPQLPLTALIVAQGGFEALGAAPVEGFEYMRVVGRKEPAKDTVGAEGKYCAALMEDAHQGFVALMRHFNSPSAAYPSQPRPQYMNAYGDYDHLARRRERNAQGGEE